MTAVPVVVLSLLLPVMDQFIVPVAPVILNLTSSPTPISVRDRLEGEVSAVFEIKFKCPEECGFFPGGGGGGETPKVVCVIKKKLHFIL